MIFRRKQPTNPVPPRRRPQGGDSPSVFSYYARGNSPSSQNTGRRDEAINAPKRRRRYKLRMGHLPSYIAGVAIVVALLSACWLQPNPKIILLSATGTVHRDPKDYQQAIVALWKQSPLNRTKITVSTGNLRRDIQAQFNELEDVQIELPLLGHRPTIILKPAEPALQFISNNGSFFVDTNGKVMARTTDVSQNEPKDMPLVHDETGLSAETGKVILAGSQALFLQRLFAQLKAQNIAVQSLTLPASAANEADVRVTGQNYYIKFSFDSDVRQAVGTYVAAKAKLDAERTVPSEYIDVRVEEKVFYK